MRYDLITGTSRGGSGVCILLTTYKVAGEKNDYNQIILNQLKIIIMIIMKDSASR